MRQDAGSPQRLMPLGIIVLLLSGFLLLVVIGADSYADAVEGQEQNMENRAALAYLSTIVRSGDARGAVRVRESELGQVLEIADGDSGYALRIYQYEGQLLEEYASEGAAPVPKLGQVIARSEDFRIEQPRRDLLIIHTDEGRVLLRLRSEEGERG